MNLKETLAGLEEDIINMQEEIGQIKNILLSHYHKLLSEGRDTRYYI